MNNDVAVRPICCANCAVTIGYRSRDSLIANGFEVEFKQTHRLKCECGCYIPFIVTAKNRLQSDVKQVS